MVVHTDDRPQHLSLGYAEPAQTPAGQADPPAAARSEHAVWHQHAGAVLPTTLFRAVLRRVVGRAADLRDGPNCGGNSAEGVECDSRRAKVGGAGKAAAPGSA